MLYYMPDTDKYTSFRIHKRSGGLREINAPQNGLKTLQRRVANLLYSCLAEIEKSGQPRRPLSHGFSKRLSIVTNASVHKNRRYVLNFDLADFFPSINFGRVRGVLIKDRRFALQPKVATIIAQIASYNNSLPQGSPCSPVLSNIVAHILDICLVNLARKYKCTYSRYADDITFSTNQHDFPVPIAAPINPSTKWSLGKIVHSEVKRCGFEINDDKTRMQIRGSRQITTGLVVNKKVNIRQEYYRTVRSMCSLLFNSGSYFEMKPATLEGGKKIDPDIRVNVDGIAKLEGRLGYIYYVRNRVDTRDIKDKKKSPTATRRLYYRLLFYKNFVALEKPLIIPEGKTDSIYLYFAIKSLLAFHPRLGEFTGSSFSANVRFMKYTSIVHDVLQLGGGTGDFKFFMLKYEEMLSGFRFCPRAQPVIILVDNDDGAKEVFSVAKELKINGLSLNSTEPFYRIHRNLYLVKTPEGPKSNPKTCIEDLFDTRVRNMKLNGLQFDPNRKSNDRGTYGKTVFAEKIIRPNANSIDFSKFSIILDRIILVLDDYRTNPNK